MHNILYLFFKFSSRLKVDMHKKFIKNCQSVEKKMALWYDKGEVSE